MHRSRLVILVGTALTGIALALPHVSAPPIGAIDGFEGASWPALAILAVPALLAVAGDRREGLGLPGSLVAILATAIATVFAVAKLLDAVLAAREIRALIGQASVGSGAWLLLLAVFVTLAGSVMTMSRRVA